MLKKSQRISKKDLQSTHSPFSYHKTPYFSFKLRRNEVGNLRFALVVSKKTDKRAVVRNGLKRRMAHVVEKLPATPGYDIVIFIKKDIETLSFSQLETVVSHAFKKHLPI